MKTFLYVKNVYLVREWADMVHVRQKAGKKGEK